MQIFYYLVCYLREFNNILLIAIIYFIFVIAMYNKKGSGSDLTPRVDRSVRIGSIQLNGPIYIG